MTLKDNIGKDYLRYDAAAGLVVFLVAVPLCLGIALASGAPLLAGLVAGFVGGIVVGFLSGSDVSVSGPAAGLTVIVATAIHNLGYPAFLVAVILAGVLQLAFGALRLGALADYVPTAVIKGMLAAIGIVIVLKQIPHALGRDLDFEMDMRFIEPDGKENTLSAIVKALLSASPGALLISGASLGILLTWDKYVAPRAKALKLVPAPLVVVVVGTLLNELFRLRGMAGFYLRGEDGHLVTLPILGSPLDIFGELTRPAWSALRDEGVYVTGVTLAAVASLESLLALEAGQRLDPYKRIALPNRELIAQGLGNLTSGLLGGLPVTSVVVRTSANVYAGNRTRWSTIFHGLLLLVAVLFLGRVLNHIPLAALAAILIVIGSKLMPRALFQEMWGEGLSSFVPFFVTIVAIVFTDLLKGVLIGLAFGVFFVIRTNSHAAMIVVSQDEYYLLRFNKDISFVHKAELKEKLSKIPEGATLIIDGTRALHVDRDAFEVLDDYRETAKFKDIKVEFKNLRGKRPDGEPPAATR